jgi:ATP-dependent Lon protease
MRLNPRNLLIAIVAATTFSAPTLNGQPTGQDPQGRPRQTKPIQKPVPEPTDTAPLTTPIQEPDEAMRRAITNLSTQIGLLADEMRKLRRETERNSGTMELLLNEDRLAKLEDKIQEAVNYKMQLEAREQEIQRRMRNIQGEVLLRGGLRREEAEAAMRVELQRALEDVRSQQTVHHQRVAELNEQATRLRARVEIIRKKIDLTDGKSEKEEK